MPCLPVIPAELGAAEAALGIALPEAWKQRLLDPRVQCVLADERIGVLRPQDTMAAFVELTHRLRALHPEFPRDGVVAACGVEEDGAFNLRFGYVRFWLPDKRQAARLGDTIHSWSLTKRRASRDCGSAEWIDLALSSADPALLAAQGLVPQVPADTAAPVRTRPGDGELMHALGLRGEAANALLAGSAGRWWTVGTLAVAGGQLTPCDLGQVPARAHKSVGVTPGAYAAQVRLEPSAHGNGPVVAALRITRSTHATPGRELFRLDIDHAAVAVFDRQPLLRQVPPGEREALSLNLAALTALPCMAVIGRDAEAVLVPAGDGDGTYPVLELLDGGDCVGLELRFAAAGAPR